MTHKEREQLIWLVGYAIGTMKGCAMMVEPYIQDCLNKAVAEVETRLDKIMGIEK
jgi:hypothetical protein